MTGLEAEGILSGAPVAARAGRKAIATTSTRTTTTKTTTVTGLPTAAGMFDPAEGRDSCGVGFIAHIKGVKSHAIVRDALQVLENMEHRGAVGADPLMGDGAGILVQIPDAFFREECGQLGIALPEVGRYAVGVFFLPREERERARAVEIIEKTVRQEALTVLGWREVPVDNSCLSDGVRATEPVQRQLFIGQAEPLADQAAFERKLYITRKLISGFVYEADWNGATKRDQDSFYVVSMSSRTVTYKGMFLAYQLAAYYPDLADERFVSALRSAEPRLRGEAGVSSWNGLTLARFCARDGASLRHDLAAALDIALQRPLPRLWVN